MTTLRVKTEHSAYVIDTDAKTYMRTPGELAPNQLRHPRETRTYSSLDGLYLGGVLHIFEPDGYYLHSTNVKSIEEVEATA